MTDDEVKALLKDMSTPTDVELREQCRGAARAEAGMGSDADEAAYRKAWREDDEQEMKRLETESQERISRFDERKAG